MREKHRQIISCRFSIGETADPCSSRSGLNPLHLAVRRDGERALRLLVEGGAKINAVDQKSGNTALHLAVRENLFKVACTLITEVRAVESVVKGFSSCQS